MSTGLVDGALEVFQQRGSDRETIDKNELALMSVNGRDMKALRDGNVRSSSFVSNALTYGLGPCCFICRHLSHTPLGAEFSSQKLSEESVWSDRNTRPLGTPRGILEQGYLKFPLLDAAKTSSGSGITNRKMMAYATALGVTGKVGKRRETLQKLIAAAAGAGISLGRSKNFYWLF